MVWHGTVRSEASLAAFLELKKNRRKEAPNWKSPENFSDSHLLRLLLWMCIGFFTCIDFSISDATLSNDYDNTVDMPVIISFAFAL